MDDVDDALAPAREAGLVREPEAGTVAFTHALTRDAVAATTTPSRLARLHARVAHALADGGAVGAPGRPRGAGGRAGPALAGRRSVVRRPRLAGRRRRRRAGPPYLLVGGGRAAGGRRDRGPPPRPARARRRSGSTCCSPGPATAAPTRVGPGAPLRGRGDRARPARGRPARLVAAAAAATDNLVWMSQQWNEVLEDTVEDLRWALRRAPHDDSADRCRVMLALARAALLRPRRPRRARGAGRGGPRDGAADRRPGAAGWAAQTAWKALWTPSTARPRLSLARQGLQATRAAADPDSEAVALVRAGRQPVRWATGRPTRTTAEETERLARRRRNSYALMALAWVRLSLASMRRDEAAVDRLAAGPPRAAAAAQPRQRGAARRWASTSSRTCGTSASAS